MRYFSGPFLLILTQLLFFKPVKAQVEFVENKGQWDSHFRYRADFAAAHFYLEKKGFNVVIDDSKELQAISEVLHPHAGVKPAAPRPVTLHSFLYQVNFLQASDDVQTVPDKPLSSYNNYFIGNDSKKWAGGCKLFQAITYKNIYPNIDVRFYSDNGHLKYDFVVRPGGNVSSIALQYNGPDLFLKDKDLIIKTPVGEVKELSPYSYQSPQGTRNEVSCRYILKNNVVTFDVKNYDHENVLVIDPTVIFSSYVGSRSEVWGFTATPGPAGTLFAGGIALYNAQAPPAYPVSPGAFQTTFGGGDEEFGSNCDIAIFKFSANGSSKIYATYLGGSGSDQPHSMIADGQGNLIVAGKSTSSNFPVTRGNPGSGGGYDIIVTKFNPAGTALLGSIKIGGSADDGVNIRPKYRGETVAISTRQNYGDDSRGEVILGGGGSIIIASCTQSNNFPVVGNSLNSSGGFAGQQDGLILKFNGDLSSYIYGSYFGGAGDDACFVTSINPITGNLYVGGPTTSTNLPGDKTGAIHSSNQGDIDGFITELDLNAGAIIKTSYLGTSGKDIVFGLKFDRKGFPYVMGTTTGNWPVTPGIFSNPNSSQFIAKLKPDLSGFEYSTVFGTGSHLPNLSPIAFLVDRCENVYVSGWGGGLNGTSGQGYNQGNTVGLPEVNPLPGIPAADGNDFYFFVLQKNAQSQLFGTHFGQNGQLGDHVDGGTSRFDDNGVIYQAECACSNDPNVHIPTTSGAWATTWGNNACDEAVIKIKMDFAGVGAGLQADINGLKYDTAGCVPLTVNFRDTLLLGKTYYWDFGDGSPPYQATTSNISHTFNSVGHFIVRLVSEDLNTCNVRDTAYVTIRVGNNVADLAFIPVKDTPCTSTTYTFKNKSTSTFLTPGFTAQTFTWDFGDGSPQQVAIDGRHTFSGPGRYAITLTLNDTSYCNSPLSITDTLRVYDLVKADFTTGVLGCAPYHAKFDFKTGGAGTDFFWNFGDGTFSTDSTDAFPTHYYPNPGVYAVQLIVRDTNTCNKIDTSAFFNITVLPRPVAAFTWSPDPPQTNKATQFTNLSTGALRYLWDFGEDGETSTEVNPRHQFNSTGTFKVTLTAYNQNNCDSTVSRLVRAIVDPLLDVPNAFTPGRFGINGKVMVAGYGIGKMDWKIYNRWGELVYQTTSRKQAWDGMYKGKLQPMDVYAYTLDVIFTDGKKLRKTGDITLLR